MGAVLTPSNPYVALAVGSTIAVTTVVALSEESGAGTYAGRSTWFLCLELAASGALLVSGLIYRAATLAWVGSLWLGPEWAGLSAFPPWVRTVADSLPFVLAALLVVTASCTWQRHRNLALAALSGGLLAGFARALLVDRFQDPRCWRLCDHNPLALGHLTSAGLAVVLVAATVLLGAAGTGFVAVARGRDVEPLLCYALAALLVGPLLSLVAIPASDPHTPFVGVIVAAQLVAITLGLLAGIQQLESWVLTRRLHAVARSLVAVAGDSVEEALRRALHEPELALFYWVSDLDGYVDAEGRRVGRIPTGELLRPDGGLGTTSVMRHDRPVALLIHGRSLDGPRVARTLRPGVLLALENEQLRAAANATLRDLEASRGRILERATAERHRLERNLHDGTQQRLVSLALLVRMLKGRVRDDADIALAERAEALILRTLDEVRRIARGIYPASLADGGLSIALNDLAETTTGIAVRVDRPPQRRYSGTVESTVYLVSAAAIGDARARAASCLCIRATETPDHLVLDLEDDATKGGLNGSQAGVTALADQVAAVAGRLAVGATADGVRVRLEVPCES